MRWLQVISVVFFVISLNWIAAHGINNMTRVTLSRTINGNGGNLGQPLTSYYLKVDIGTPGKPFRLLVDVNARETWIPHYITLIGMVFTRLNYKNGYAKKFSSTSVKEETKEYKIEHQSCVLTGKAYKDIFLFKDVAESLAVPQITQRFLAISSATNDIFGRRGEVDGVIAFNPWPLSEIGSDQVSVTLSRAGLIRELIFGLALEDNLYLDKQSPSPGGELSMGGLNSNYYTGSIRYHTVWSQYNWELKLQSVLLGSSPISACGQVAAAAAPAGSGSSAGECKALISTSHNDIYAPSADVKQILNLLGFKVDIVATNRLYEIDCLKAATAPNLTFVIDGAYYNIPSTSYIRRFANHGGIFDNNKTQSCYIAILANDATENQWILGTNFLTNYYTVFDMNHRRIGFGTRK